jgi:hypothetical protein
MGGLEDFGEGFESPFKWAYHKAEKVDRVADNALDGVGNLTQGLSNLLGGLASGNILLYLGIGIVAIVVINKKL